MDWESNTDFIDLCRLCLRESGTCTIHEITHLPRDIFLCTGIEVIVTDNLPKKICNNCNDTIKKAMDFRDLASKNDLHMKSLRIDTTKEMLSEDFVSSTISNIENKSKFFDLEEGNVQLQIQQNINPDNQTDMPVKMHKIYIRKDLFPTSTQNSLEEKNKTQDTTIIKQQKIEPTEILEYNCGLCCRKFETWKKLYLHSRLHNKNIECPIEFCDKMFATKGDMEKHVRTHTGEKPFECNICQRKFTQRCSLKSHIEKIHS